MPSCDEYQHETQFEMLKFGDLKDCGAVVADMI